MKQAIILDLDNTIYPVSSILAALFQKIYALLEQHLPPGDIEAVKDDMARRPFHLVAEKFNFSDDLKTQVINTLKNLTYDLPMQPFDDYRHIRLAPVRKFLVTTGFYKLQWSKVKMLGIEDHFIEVHIVDPETSGQTKKDVFADILNRHNYAPADVLVIGDDPQSEIKAAVELGIDTFLFDPDGKHAEAIVTYRAMELKDAVKYL